MKEIFFTYVDYVPRCQGARTSSYPFLGPKSFARAPGTGLMTKLFSPFLYTPGRFVSLTQI
jgi:hypothetical protein